MDKEKLKRFYKLGNKRSDCIRKIKEIEEEMEDLKNS